MEVLGGCSCGAVRYRLTSEPLFVHCCHCLDCQRQTGSAFVINALIELDRIELLGAAPEATAMPTDSGQPHDIYRCAACKVAVWSDCSKVPWVTLPPGVRAFEAFYEVAKQWPAASLARRAAVLATPG
jgi:hypothetical protein